MTKLIKKAAIFSIPFIIVFLLFFCFEPFDYFGLKGDATYLSKPLSAMRELERNHPSEIILGDSRMANLSTEYIREISGESYTMLGFGGATLGESIEMFWYATEHTNLEKVVFGVSFYTAGGDLGSGRIPDVKKQADSTYNFLSNFNNWLEAINTAKYRTKNLIAGIFDKPQLIEYPEDPTQFTNLEPPKERGAVYRKNLEDYAQIIKTNLGKNWRVNPEAYKKLQSVIDYCSENGIELIFVFPPMHESIETLVLDPMGIVSRTEEYKQFLIDRATVYDMEFVNEFTCDESNFYDGFHLMGEQKKTLARLIFTDTQSEAIERHVHK
ncbi:MAG: hypothetical protein RR933_00160 [Oscillospiraceae bacterium]